MEFLSFLGLIFIVLIWYLVAKEFYRVAELKGYTEKKYFWYAFVFNLLGYLLIMALPDKYARKNEKTLDDWNDLPNL